MLAPPPSKYVQAMPAPDRLDPRPDALRFAITRLQGFQPYRLRLDDEAKANADEARNLAADLMELAWIIDSVIESYGDYAAQHWHGVERDLFKDQLRTALDGNATFNLTDAADG